MEAPWTATAILASRSSRTSWSAGRATRGRPDSEGAPRGQAGHIPRDWVNGWQGPTGRRYRASTAQGKADRRRLRRGRPRLMDEPERRSLIVRPVRDERWPRRRHRAASRRSGPTSPRAIPPSTMPWGRNPQAAGFRGTGMSQGCSGTMESAGTGREARSAGPRCA